MFNYIIRRLLVLPLVLIFVTMFIFGMLSLLTPYERAALYVSDIPRNPGALEGLVEKYGLNDPVPVQYWYWLVGREDTDTGKIDGGILRGSLGWSKTGKSWVWEVIGRRLPATAELALWASIPMVLIGVWFGVVAAVNHNNWLDQSLRVFSIIGWSIPTFVFGLLVLLRVRAHARRPGDREHLHAARAPARVPARLAHPRGALLPRGAPERREPRRAAHAPGRRRGGEGRLPQLRLPLPAAQADGLRDRAGDAGPGPPALPDDGRPVRAHPARDGGGDRAGHPRLAREPAEGPRRGRGAR